MYYLGVDLGGTNIAIGLVNEDGEILYKDKVPTSINDQRTYKDIVKDIAELSLKILEKNNVSIKELGAIGIGSPGSCDVENGVIMFANNLRFKNVPLRSELQKYINVPVFLDNDANCAAYGESISGACKNTDISVTVTLGTGVGAGVLYNGQIIRGKNGGGGEIGHTVIAYGGEKCSCGRNGCWEAYASATALIRDIKVAAIENPDSLINDEINGDIDKIQGKTVFDARDRGDKLAEEVISKYLDYVTEGLVNIINIFEPEVIAIGGGIASQGEKILSQIRKKISENNYGGELSTKIAIAVLGNDAGIIGSAHLYKLEKKDV